MRPVRGQNTVHRQLDTYDRLGYDMNETKTHKSTMFTTTDVFWGVHCTLCSFSTLLHDQAYNTTTPEQLRAYAHGVLQEIPKRQKALENIRWSLRQLDAAQQYLKLKPET